MERRPKVIHQRIAIALLELPGCFASGETLDELREALGEAIRLHRDQPPDGAPALRVNELTLSA